jgi:undecaprenyl-diphosphatase
VAGILGAIIGDSIGYWVGKRWGETLLNKLPNRVLKPEHITRAEESIRKFGGKTVFIGRFTAALRALIPGLAGMSKLPYGRFLAWNAGGGMLWAIAFTILGYLAGSQYTRIEHYANYFGIVLLVLIAVTLYVRHRRNTARAETTGSDTKTQPVEH